ncbi:regulatory solute carrier protein family 1 member 1-like isoform X1 [Acipenser oxyrinchus oxyrinchus]|uniref:Regulatory solute carrier protein family 1 member 1-like isoform X1 n=1 Tax=Acipenser oxyrinchus oxyrinchus TaxID=40147 RepID=A0AAD8FW49_ACIOX|nr:regulatory solute carrier protein family 1 member 1-like isoform X1 [Acipenser oxyrinchus oxyrinchus]
MLVTVFCVRRDRSEITFSLEVSAELELRDFVALCELESGIPASDIQITLAEQPLSNPQLALASYGLKDGDVVVLRQEEQRPPTQPQFPGLPRIDFSSISVPGTSAQQPSPQRQHQRQQQQQEQSPLPPPPPSLNPGASSGSSQQGLDDPALLRDMLLANPHELSLLKERNPPLAEALLSGDLERFTKVLLEQQQERARREQERIRLLTADPFDLEAQAKIEEDIRQHNIEENMTFAMEEAPESFGQVVMLYINCKVNGHPVKAFVDSGAQMTIMSQACAERCNIMRLVDRRWAGIAKGVGTQKIIGRVHLAQVQIEGDFLPCSFSILEDQPMDMLLGLDMLKRHQCSIDLKKNVVLIGTTGSETRFLPEAELPDCARLAYGQGREDAQPDEIADRELAEALERSVQESEKEDGKTTSPEPPPFPSRPPLLLPNCPSGYPSPVSQPHSQVLDRSASAPASLPPHKSTVSSQPQMVSSSPTAKECLPSPDDSQFQDCIAGQDVGLDIGPSEQSPSLENVSPKFQEPMAQNVDHLPPEHSDMARGLSADLKSQDMPVGDLGTDLPNESSVSLPHKSAFQSCVSVDTQHQTTAKVGIDSDDKEIQQSGMDLGCKFGAGEVSLAKNCQDSAENFASYEQRTGTISGEIETEINRCPRSPGTQLENTEMELEMTYPEQLDLDHKRSGSDVELKASECLSNLTLPSTQSEDMGCIDLVEDTSADAQDLTMESLPTSLPERNQPEGSMFSEESGPSLAAALLELHELLVANRQEASHSLVSDMKTDLQREDAEGMNVSDSSCSPGSTERVSEATTDAEGVIAKTDGHEFPCPFSTEIPAGVELEPSNRSQQTGAPEKDVHTLDSLADCASSGPTLDSLPARAEQEVPPSEGHAHRIPPEGRQERGVADGRAAVLVNPEAEMEVPLNSDFSLPVSRAPGHQDAPLPTMEVSPFGHPPTSSSLPGPTASFPAGQIERITNAGFTVQEAVKALEQFQGNAELALLVLLSRGIVVPT